MTHKWDQNWKMLLHSISLSSITITTQIILAESSFLDNLWIKGYMVMENAHRHHDDVIQSSGNGYPLARGHSYNFPNIPERIIISFNSNGQDFCSFTYQNISENFICLILLPTFWRSKLNCRVSLIAHNFYYSLYDCA